MQIKKPSLELNHAFLCDVPECIETLANWHVAEWAWLDPQMSVASTSDELRKQTVAHAIPTTIVAIDTNKRVLGSVSLLQNDHQKIRQYSPWLASLYVRKSMRGQGIGQDLVSRCVALAEKLGVSQLYLYTDAHVAFYTALGWSVVETVSFGQFEVTVMGLDLQRDGSINSRMNFIA